MKKILIILSLIAMGACGFEDIEPEFGVTSVYFYNQEYNRNIVVGEGLKLKVGSMLTGLVKNDKDRVVKYAINESLVTDPAKTVLPRSMYTVDNDDSFVIRKGDFIGFLGIEFDSAAFVNDPLALTGEYVLPVEITGCDDVDSVNDLKKHILVSVSYWAKQHGNYYYSGQTIRKSAGEDVDTLTYEYDRTNANSVRQLVTVGPNTLEVMPDNVGSSSDPGKNSFTFNVSVPTFGGGEVTVAPSDHSAVEVSADGSSAYDEANRTFYLKYTYNDGVYDCFAIDTLVFRNRVRDVQADGQGINEWR